MTLEERLNEIVEKQQGDAIIPFLQGLTQEERKSLVPRLNKLEEYYSKFVQLNKNTYGTRGTSAQHRIINLTALVIYSLKEFRKHQWGINTEQLNELIPWYVPSWLDSFFKEGEGKEFGGFYGMDYEVLMDWIEQGILTVTPSPQTIAGYLVSYINTTAILQKREITLKEHIWYLFEYDCGQNWMDNRNGGHPYYPYKYLIENGKLDRMRVLRESLLAVNRNMNKNLCGWFAGMFTALTPSIEEQLTLQPEILAVLSAPHSRPVNIMLGLLKGLCNHPQFRIEEFLNQTSVLFASDVKAIHQNTLAVLNKLAKERKEFRDAICCVAAQGLMSREESTQSKIVKLILAYGETESATLREALAVYTETMLANTKKELKAYLENNESGHTSAHNEAAPAHSEQPDNDSASFVYEPILPIIREDNRIQEIASPEDLLFLASQVLDGNEIYHFDLLLGALVQWDRQQDTKQISQWAPILQRAYKLLMSGGSSRNGLLDQLMATFLLDYAKLLVKRFPKEGKELSDLHQKMVQKDELQKGKWNYRNLQKLTIRQKTNQKEKFPVHKQLLCRTLDLLESKEKPLPLLSTPTHTPMFIAPATLVERLKQYQQANTEPDDMDMQIALSRVALDNSSQELPIILQDLKEEYQRLLSFLLGAEDVLPQAPFTHPSWWMTAGLIKSPETIYSEFKDFSYNKGPREFLTGNFTWRTYLRTHSYTDYNKKVVEWNSATLTFDIPESKNSHVANKNEYNEKISYHSYDSHPLVVEMYPLIERFDDIQNDLPRLAWLTPNMPEPLLVWCIRSAIYDPMLNEVREIGITKATIEALHQLRHTWHEASYILEASCMLVADKTSRSYAAEIWIDRVSKGCIDSKRIGKILGSHQHTGWGPLKRLTGLIQQQMMNVSPLHNRELENLIVAMLAGLPEKPIKDLKKLLEIYAELLSINHSKAKDEQVLHLLNVWKGVANLKKAVANIQH
ncbi:conserved hypothetical protein [Bacteroides xylanisolvens SD CC 2a]|uniref:D-tyrosyl-tRNA(Tyr) deacylase n=1 Tax=Bacteroides xylanisolvens SD CC 1b TaxID=702447 RepID=D4VG69_9BACE|nr:MULTISPECIES: DUF6493 family protein [Bacteroides]EEO48923.1 hypothetical protein BSAG_00633 [Bacteroides sp. D1]EEZ05885.1 hypothetical protein HMPREF0102_00884 [Bacteroides sp. 2_1_22]EFF55252.1 conserved hypothetical protein [Bacteroides xylanisolvens SD CC 2a]EFG15149.1 conserved hypothetical protein [Bacteroides xylanisolvens SD CC 1b]CDM01144.1 hypothetical protein BN891_40750 [Bacteroides xylanisolvens SD CC 2a]